mmetsp:Transcript_45171/g.98246  ORF Transcript_45171/g.98246 Transcript_45171/m.98246 type:complete len:726 (+) Transcript_45171:36-2213(+)
MKPGSATLACTTLLYLVVHAGAVAVDSARSRGLTRLSPVQKVVTLLGDLETKLAKDRKLEEQSFAEFSEFCKGSAKDKEFEIKSAKAYIEDLSATIGKANADVAASSSKIEGLGAAIGTNEGDLKSATEIRKKEQTHFEATQAELADAIDTLDRAINLLEHNMKGSALVQAKVNTKDTNALVSALSAVVDAAAFSINDRKKLVALAQSVSGSSASGMDEDAADAAELGAPAAAVYTAHSEGILDVLEDLREKAESQLSEARKQETSAKHNYEMLKQSLEDQIEADQKDMGEAKAVMSTAAEAKATAEGDLASTEKGLADSEAALAQLRGSCETAAADHEASMKSRAEELQALSQAKAAITEMTPGAAAAVYEADFLQLQQLSQRSVLGSGLATGADLANFEVVHLVRELAKKERSAALGQLASRITAVIKYGSGSGQDPFAKVRSLIAEMIERLESEGASEADHKAYCDKETATTKQKIDDLTSAMEGLKAKMDKKKALSVTLKGEVQELNSELGEILKSQSAMDRARASEHEAFVQVKADLEQGLEGVRLALKLLRDYFGSDAVAFQQQPAAPEYHSKATGAGSGIIGMLEVIEADFGKSLAQATTDEDSAEVEYQKITQSNKISTATKEQEVKYKTKEAGELDKAVQELASDGEGTQTELDALLEYSASINSACVAKPSTYEERKARREAEIAGLKEALAVLNGEAALLQRSHRAGLRGARSL